MTAMPGHTRLKLSLMMFLQYAWNGIWFIPVSTYLSSVGYSGENIGQMYSTFAIGCIIAPFFVGMIADKFFSAQKILGVLNIVGSLLLVVAAYVSVGPDGRAHRDASGATVLGPFYWVCLLHFICYLPTWSLTNAIALRHMSDPGRQFPSVRVIGTIGWIVVSMTTLFGSQINYILGTTTSFEATVTPIYLGAAIGFLTGIFSFFLPATPPMGHGKRVTFADIAGLKALGLLKDRNYAVFAATSFLILFPGLFYWNWANVYLNESHMTFAQAWQSTGQMTEMVFLFIMPLFFARFGVKYMLVMGLVAWVLRFTCFSFGAWGTATAALVVLGLMLHGPCYDFFFVTGQLYTDKKASADIRAQAQGLIFLITFGLGWFLASHAAGYFVDFYASKNVPTQVSGAAYNKLAAFAAVDLPETVGKSEADLKKIKSADLVPLAPAATLAEIEALVKADQDRLAAAASADTETRWDALKWLRSVVHGSDHGLTEALVQTGPKGPEPKGKIKLDTGEVKEVPMSLHDLVVDCGKIEEKEKALYAPSSLVALVAANYPPPEGVSPDHEVIQSDATKHDWAAVYRWPIGMAAVILVFFVLFFKDKMAVGRGEEPATA